MEALIRDAHIDDSEAIASLAEQLGYSVSVEEVALRLRRLSLRPDQRVIVAETEKAEVVGWTTFEITEHIHSAPYVEVSGFVVEQRFRGKGVGKKMMEEVERWSRERGFLTIRLHANVTRKPAHLFYQAIGFEKIKEQYSFQKKIRK